jgi:hypothetical protein
VSLPAPVPISASSLFGVGVDVRPGCRGKSGTQELRNSGKNEANSSHEDHEKGSNRSLLLRLMKSFLFSLPEFLSSRFISVPLPCLPYSRMPLLKIKKNPISLSESLPECPFHGKYGRSHAIATVGKRVGNVVGSHGFYGSGSSCQ